MFFDGEESEDGFSEDEVESSSIAYKKNQVLICVDSHPSLFTETEDDEGNETSIFKIIIDALFKLVDNCLLRKNVQPFCVLLVAGKDCKTIIPFKGNLINAYKTLKQIKDLSLKELQAQYETEESKINFAAVIRKSVKEIKNLKGDYNRKLLFFTNNSNPENDQSKRFAAFNEARNFKQQGIFFDLIAMSQSFDYSLFYNEMLKVMGAENIVETVCLDSEGVYSHLSRYIMDFLTSLNFKFYLYAEDQENFITIKKHAVFTKKRLYASDLATRENKFVKRVKCSAGEKDNSDRVSSSRGPFFPTTLTYEQKQAIKAKVTGIKFNRGFYLLYLADQTTSFGESADKIFLISAGTDERSLHLYDSYWQHCYLKKKVIVCVYRPSTRIKIVELVPKLYKNKKYFLVKIVPFADEICKDNLKPENSIEITNPNKHLMEELVDKLSFDFDPLSLQDKEYLHTSLFIKRGLLNMEITTDIINIDDFGQDLSDLGNRIKNAFGLRDIEAANLKRKRYVKKQY